MKTKRSTTLGVIAGGVLALWIAIDGAAGSPDAGRAASLHGCFGTYASAPRGKDGRVDVERLTAELVEMRANTYHWLIWTAASDWDDLKRFLPLARGRGILVWVCLVPPSESPPHTKNYSEPFKLDYERWAVEIARLSRTEPNLVAWSIDDFSHNLAVFTPERLGAILEGGRKINPRLAFVPCIYFPKAAQASTAKDYGGLLDGLLFPYRHESAGANLTDAGLVGEEVGKIRAAWGATFPVIVDVYSTRHSRLGDSTPDYVRQVMAAGIRCADGVLVYTHPRPGSEKHTVASRLFHEWAGDASLRKPATPAATRSRAATVQNLTLPEDKRPEWLRRDGIVMAGNWEPLLFRVRRDGATGYTPTPEQRAAYEREHSPEMLAKLKSLGVNFVMMHCYKGGGLGAERESMADAVRFARLCHDAGLRVGCYTYSGAFIWELFFKEMPEAKDWVVLSPDGSPVTYGKANYRYFWNRNHPGAEAFYRKIVRFAVEDIQTDLVHFDNYTVGPGHDVDSIARFREYLRQTFSPSVLRDSGIADVGAAMPPEHGGTNLVARAWADFCCQSLSDSFHAMTRYARALKPDVIMETNPAGVGPTIRGAVDHGRLLRGGEAFWDEGRHPGFVGGTLHTRIRTYKAARSMGNLAFAYIINPLEAAESMAFNLDCLGAICWFEYGDIVEKPGVKTPMSSALGPFVSFYHRRHDLLRDARVVADVGVFRSFPSMQFGPRAQARLPGDVEDALAANRCAFQIVFDQQLEELSRWPVLVMPGCIALSDAQVGQIRAHVSRGGRLCVIGPLATHDEWMLPRDKPALDDLPQDRVVRIAENGDWMDAVRRACGGPPSMSVASDPSVGSPDGLRAELTEQPGRRMVHLVNYRADNPMRNVVVRVALPNGKTAKSVAMASPEHDSDIALPFRQGLGLVDFTVPAIGIYEIAVVTMK